MADHARAKRAPGYVLRDGENTILVDPARGEAEPLLATLDELVRGRVGMLVTTRSTCAAPRCGGAGATRHEVTIFGH